MSRRLLGRISLSLLILVVAVVVAFRVGGENPFRLATSVPLFVYAGVIVCILLNSLAAAARFSFIASQLSGAIGFRESIAVVSAGSLGGAIFSIFGQVAARAATMARRQSDSFANAVVVTAYEKASAAIVSAVGAMVGAYVVFGHIGVDWVAGGPMVKLALVGIAAGASGIALGGAARSLLPRITLESTSVFLVALVCSVAVQIPTMAAYILAAHSLAPDTSLTALLGATLIVMFAASVPISFAGWGVRELSAVAALGAVGVEPAQAVLAAIIVGVGSMLTAGVFAAVTIPHAGAGELPKAKADVRGRSNTALLTLAVPLAAAIAVPFQIYVPVSSSVVNVNLADPLAIVGAALFVLRHISRRQWPITRHSLVLLAFGAMSLALTISLFVGFAHFGVTTWAVMNRFAGWAILLAYVMTGALVVSEHGSKGLLQIAAAFVGSMATVALVEVLLVAASNVVAMPESIVALTAVKGFAQNRNAFAFQLLIALAVALAVLDRKPQTLVAVAAIVGGIVLTFSRSGMGTLIAVLVTVALIRTDGRRQLGAAVAAIIGAVALYVATGAHDIFGRLTIAVVSGFAERMQTITGGLRLFEANPIFGAGLGAYRNEGHLMADGEPLVIHSSYVWLLAETGLFGFVCFVLPATALFIKELRRARTDTVAAAIVLCLMVAAIMGLPADMLYQRTLWLVLGALLVTMPTPVSAERSDAQQRA